GLLHQLRLRAARPAPADASAHGTAGVDEGALAPGECGAGFRARARGGPSARSRRALRPWQGNELVRWFEQRVDTVAGWHALSRSAAHRTPRGRHTVLCATR